MRRIDDALETCPTRQLDTSHLSPANLVEGERHIYFRILAAEKSQLADIIVLMLADKVLSRLVHHLCTFISLLNNTLFITIYWI